MIERCVIEDSCGPIILQTKKEIIEGFPVVQIAIDLPDRVVDGEIPYSGPFQEESSCENLITEEIEEKTSFSGPNVYFFAANTNFLQAIKHAEVGLV